MNNIFFARTQEDCLLGMINKLKSCDYESGNHVFIVPDKMTVSVEKRIFEVLGIESTTNIQVLTLSRLAKKIVDVQVVDKSTSVMLIKKILGEERQNLLCFNKTQDTGLAEDIYGTIAQFKSCKINFDIDGKSLLLTNKLHDLSLIYKKYAMALSSKGLLDSSDRLDILPEKIKSSFIRNSNVYVVGFDGFTIQGYQVVSALSLVAKEFSIAIPNAEGALNEHIYSASFKENILEILPTDKTSIFAENNAGDFKFMQDNLFCFQPNSVKKEDFDVKLFACENLKNELEFCASKIKQLILEKKYNPRDFFVAISGLNGNKTIVKNIFDEYNLPYFLDVQTDFSSSILCRFILDAISVLQEKFSLPSVLSFLKNGLVSFDEEKVFAFEDCAMEFNLVNGHEIKTFDFESCKNFDSFSEVRGEVLSILADFEKDVAGAKTFNDFISATKNFLQKIDVESLLNNFIVKLNEKGDLLNQKLFEQYLGKFEEVCDGISKVLGETSCNLKIFVETLSSGFDAVKLSTPPLSTNDIFVGDVSISYFERRKIGFVLGANEGALPICLDDCGLITDEDINLLSDKYLLEPTIRDLNKKERYKVYELLLKPTEKLFVTYENSAPPSDIVKQLRTMFLVQKDGKFGPLPVENGSTTGNVSLKSAKTNLTKMLREYKDGGELDKDAGHLFLALKNQLPSDYLENFDYKNIQFLKSNPFFKNGKLSVSQIESFMTCPFLHFVRYGLNLKEKDDSTLNTPSIGLVLHEVAKRFLKGASKGIDETQVDEFAKNIFESVLELEDFAGFKHNVTNKILLKNIEIEAVNLCQILYKQLSLTTFKPTYFEERFDKTRTIKNIDVEGLSLVGQVDRIDTCGDYFRIIDYKSGKSDFSYKDLYFGKKVQLEAYLKVVENSLKLKPAGMYYYPIKNSFDDDESSVLSHFKMSGITLKDDEVVDATDNSLAHGESKSELVDVAINKGKTRTYNSRSKLATGKELEKMSNYAIDVIKKAKDDITSLQITPSPLVYSNDNPCSKCKYLSLCRLDATFGNVQRTVSGSSDSFKQKFIEKKEGDE